MLNNKYFTRFIYCFIFCIFVLLTQLILKNIVLIHEDIDFYANITQFIYYPDNGSYPASFIKVITSWYIPKLLHIHPNDFVVSFGSYFRAFNIVLLSYILSLLPFIDNKNHSLSIKKMSFHLLFFIIAYFAVWGAMFRYNAYDLQCDTAFCRLFIPNIFFAFFWLYWTKYFINPENLKFKPLLLILFTAFILGTSFELTTIISLISMFFILLYGIIKKQKLLYLYILPFLSLIIGSLFLFLNLGFIDHYESKNSTLAINAIVNNLKLYQDFFNTYWSEIIKSHLICYVIIISSAIFSFMDKENKDAHKITLISLFLTAGFLILFLLFIIMGKNHPTGNFWWLTHWGIKITMRLCLLVPAILAINPLVQRILTCKHYILLANVYILMAFIITISMVNYKNDIDDLINTTLQTRKKVYKYDKLVVSELNANLPIKLPRHYFDWQDELELNYLKTMYGLNINNVVFLSSETSIENIAQELKIPISEQELKNLKFQNLIVIHHKN